MFGLILAVLLWLFIERTRIGAIIRAGVSDAQMVGGLGINIQLIFAGVFALGTALAGVIGAPVRTLYPGLDFEILILTLVAVVIGGLLLGYTGLPSFGHAAYFGLGAYVLAYIASRSELALNLTGNLLLTVPAVVIVTALVALVVGLFALLLKMCA